MEITVTKVQSTEQSILDEGITEDLDVVPASRALVSTLQVGE